MQFIPKTDNSDTVTNNDNSEKKNSRTTNEILKIGWSIFGMVAITLVGGLSFFKWYFPDGSIPAENLLTLLSFLLAFFSIGLSVFFYFKANDSTNLFYDNSYKFTKETSELLGRIEAGFGEKLTNIQRSNTELSNKIDNSKIAEKQINENNEKINEIEKKYNKSIDELLSKTTLAEEEKEKVKNELALQKQKTERLKQETQVLKQQLEVFEEHKNYKIPLVGKSVFDADAADNLMQILRKYEETKSKK